MRRFDFPFSGQDSYAALPWIIAFMVFLCVLCVALALNIEQMAERWQEGQTARLTLHIAEEEGRVALIERVKTSLEKRKEVAKVTVLSDDAVKKMLAPWLGRGEALEMLPLPSLIEVDLVGGEEEAKKVTAMLAKQFPAAEVDDHRTWLSDFQSLVSSVRWAAYSVVGVIIGILAVLLVMASRTELALHASTVDLLRSLGAEQEYVATQFQMNALGMGLRGVAFGAAAGMGVLLLFEQLASRVNAPFLPLMQVTLMHWGALLLVVTGCLMLTGLSARFSVLRRLHAMP